MYRKLNIDSLGHVIRKSGKIERIEYDPNRTAKIALCSAAFKGGAGFTHYQICPAGVEEGDEIRVLKLKDANPGEVVFNVSMKPGQMGKIGRAAGAGCKILKQENGLTVLRLPSSVIKILNDQNECSIGTVNSEPRKPLGKAGANRRKGIRPTVRGTAMNAVDHPSGGKTQRGIPYTP